ncbi:MAG: type II 3-dehydroquinate dehydratase [Pseudomonadota bacterium]
MADRRVFILNGPNLNLLGKREPAVYGTATLADIEAALRAGAPAGVVLECRQTNGEGVLVDWVQEAGAAADALIVNPGAYAHTSIALRDAVAAIDPPCVEVHLSNVHARESFRRRSYLAGVAAGVVCGFGAAGYRLALDGVLGLLDNGTSRL